jgi:hypothetical protein
VIFVVGENNWRSRKAVLKLGATEIPITKDLPHDGELDGRVAFRLEKTRWRP